MRSGRIAAALWCGCFLALPALAADKTADSGKDVDGANLPSGEFTGQLVSPPATDGSFTLKVEFDRVVLKPGAARSANRDVQRLVQDQERIDRTEVEMARARTPSEYRRLAQQLAGEIERMRANAVRTEAKETGDYTVQKDSKDIDFHTADNVRVRIMNLPVVFDDKGNPKQYTKDELAKLKGDNSNLPGYQSDVSNLKAGDTVKVTLSAPKTTESKDADPKTDEAKKGNEVTMILILAENNSDNGGKKKQ